MFCAYTHIYWFCKWKPHKSYFFIAFWWYFSLVQFCTQFVHYCGLFPMNSINMSFHILANCVRLFVKLLKFVKCQQVIKLFVKNTYVLKSWDKGLRSIWKIENRFPILAFGSQANVYTLEREGSLDLFFSTFPLKKGLLFCIHGDCILLFLQAHISVLAEWFMFAVQSTW